MSRVERAHMASRLLFAGMFNPAIKEASSRALPNVGFDQRPRVFSQHTWVVPIMWGTGQNCRFPLR